jgi:hypothetical protein
VGDEEPHYIGAGWTGNGSGSHYDRMARAINIGRRTMNPQNSRKCIQVSKALSRR